MNDGGCQAERDSILMQKLYKLSSMLRDVNSIMENIVGREEECIAKKPSEPRPGVSEDIVAGSWIGCCLQEINGCIHTTEAIQAKIMKMTNFI